MIGVSALRKVFREKLERTDNLDAAFVKAVWTAYKIGLADAPAVRTSTVTFATSPAAGAPAKQYGYNVDARCSAAIFELGTVAADREHCTPSTPGVVVGTSEWVWMTEDTARRICASLTYFSGVPVEAIEKMAQVRLSGGQQEEG